MKKIWSYISMFFIGLSTGIIIAVKYLNEKTVYKGNFKLKQRGRGNEQMMEVKPEINNQAKREAKKQAKIIKRNKKRTKKAAKKLSDG